MLLSSVTDAYQPLECKYKLTRGALEVLLDYGYRVDILTKSDLVIRDMDLIKRFDEIEVGFTVTSLDDSVRRAFEPGASNIPARLEALKKFSDEGVQTYAFLGPMLPYLSEERLEELLNVLADRVNRLLVDRLNIKCGNMPDIKGVLGNSYPDLAPMFEAALKPDSNYYPDLKLKILRLCRKRSIPVEIIF